MDDYVSIAEAARVLGVSRWTMYRLIEREQLATFDSPLNQRVRLIRRADLQALLTPRPRPVERREEKDAA